jgi:sulfur carrier protein
MTKITLNGALQELENSVTITKLIALNNIAQPEMVSVQLNGEFVLRDDFESTEVQDGDEIDFLYFMGGGNASFIIQ